MIIDSCAAHKTQKIKETFHDLDAESILIPGSCTKHLQWELV
jgi:hypothetical protein